MEDNSKLTIEETKQKLEDSLTRWKEITKDDGDFSISPEELKKYMTGWGEYFAKMSTGSQGDGTYIFNYNNRKILITKDTLFEMYIQDYWK